MSYAYLQAKYYTPGGMVQPRAIVVHMAEGGGTASWLTHPSNDNSSHFVIEYSGRIVQMVKEADASHSLHVDRPSGPPVGGDFGTYSLDAAEACLGGGIADPCAYIFAVEIEGYAATGPGLAQATSLGNLVHDLHARHPSLRGLLGHRDFQDYKACPGGKIPWAALGGHGLFLPETSTTGDTMSIVTISILPSLGTLVIPAGVATSGIKLNPATGAIASRVPWAASDKPSSAHYDATVDLSAIGIRGNPFVRVADGALVGTYVSSAGLTLTPPVLSSARDAANAALDKVAGYTLSLKG